VGLADVNGDGLADPIVSGHGATLAENEYHAFFAQRP
jgi:hypothetical protein